MQNRFELIDEGRSGAKLSGADGDKMERRQTVWLRFKQRDVEAAT